MSQSMEAYTINLHNNDNTAQFPRLVRDKVTMPTLPKEPGYVLVQIRATTVNWRDLLVAQNSPLYLPTSQGLIPLGDGAGVIIDISEPSIWSTGDRVITIPCRAWQQGYDVADFVPTEGFGAGNVHGVLAKYVVFRDDHLVRAPKNFSFEESACLPIAGGTAWNALFHGPIPTRPGSIILIQGTGGVSMIALQLAKAAGATVIAISSSDEKLKVAKTLGATHTINYVDYPNWGVIAFQLADGRGVDHVIDIVGLKTADNSIKAVRQGGLVTFVGFLGGEHPPPDVVNQLLLGGKSARGLLAASKSMLRGLVRAIEANDIHPHLGEVFDWEHAREAFTALASGKVCGKIIIKV